MRIAHELPVHRRLTLERPQRFRAGRRSKAKPEV